MVPKPVRVVVVVDVLTPDGRVVLTDVEPGPVKPSEVLDGVVDVVLVAVRREKIGVDQWVVFELYQCER